MVRTLRRINKLIEIAMLVYTIAFKILMIGGKLIESIILKGGKLGLKNKDEFTIGRVLKGLANTLTENNFERRKLIIINNISAYLKD